MSRLRRYGRPPILIPTNSQIDSNAPHPGPLPVFPFRGWETGGRGEGVCQGDWRLINVPRHVRMSETAGLLGGSWPRFTSVYRSCFLSMNRRPPGSWLRCENGPFSWRLSMNRRLSPTFQYWRASGGFADSGELKRVDRSRKSSISLMISHDGKRPR